MMKPAPEGSTPVKYIGHRQTYVDGAFGTGIRFTQGETEWVPDAIARQMFRHTAVYQPGDAAQASGQGQAAPAAAADTEQDMQDLRDQVAVMDKAALKSIAKVRFNFDFAGNTGVETMRAKVTGLLDQFGV